MPDYYALMRHMIWSLDPESAHRTAMLALRLAPAWALPNPGVNTGLGVSVWGQEFSSPIGVAAGLDKHAEVARELFAVGFGFVEVGGVTLHPQLGNPKPRLFRLTEDRAVINRMGLNSVGAEVVARRLEKYKRGSSAGPLAVNLGLNKDSTDPPSDYAALAAIMAPFSDILTVNVSSPNTPGLRALQNPSQLAKIVNAVRNALALSIHPPVVLVKIAPDFLDQDVAELARLAVSEDFDGLVVANTTIERPSSLRSPHRMEAGGLSGAPLFDASTTLLHSVYRATEGSLPLVGVGGVSSGSQAYSKIRAGASLVQLYSALVFEGPSLVGRVKSELSQMLASDGFTTVAEAIGADHRTGKVS